MKTLATALVFLVCAVTLHKTAEATQRIPGPNATHRAPDFEVSGSKVKGKLEIKAVAPALHHFNLKAPMLLERVGTSFTLNPTQAGEQFIFFKVNDLTTASYEIALYLCDDAKSYCEKHKVTATWDGEKSELHGSETARYE